MIGYRTSHLSYLYVVTAGYLTVAVSGNSLCKFANDTYLIIPASNKLSHHTELVKIQNWATRNNLLNSDKSCEIVFTGGDGMLMNQHHCQESCTAATWKCWAWSLKTTSLFYTFNDSWRRAHSKNCALLVLRCHGLNEQCGFSVRLYRATVVARLTYVVARFHQGIWSPVHQLSDRLRLTPRILLARYTNVWWTLGHPGRRTIQQSCSIVGPHTARTITTIFYGHRLTTLQPQTPCTLPIQLSEHTS